jgi:diketogulonate reductase-like aldo/keto reductase
MRVLILLALSSYAAAGPAKWLPQAYPTIPMNGVEGKMDMPLVGLGTWQYNASVAEGAVTEALKVGFRHIDTALGYNNQLGVGAALKKSQLPRNEFFVTSKIPGGLNASATEAALDLSLEQLGLTYVDLMLVHFPATWTGIGGAASRKEEWLAIEKWAKSGKARAIGVSHYCKSHMEDVLSVATLPIALNQVMYHVGMGMSPNLGSDYKDYCQSIGVVYMSFSTLCGPCDGADKTELISGPLVTEIGKAHNVTGPQVALRWAVQQGIPVVPKSATVQHLKEDFDLFSFSLTQAEMDRLTNATTPATGRDDSGDCEVKSASLIV